MPENILPAMAGQLAAFNKIATPFSLRLQTLDDLIWVEALQAKVFGPGRFARTAFRVREMICVDPQLCLIAVLKDQRVGSVWMTPISLSGEKGFLLGPLATDSTHRNRGVGRLLVKCVTQMALAKLPEGFVVLVGDAPYYAPLGFEMAKLGAIVFPGPVDTKRVLVLSNRLNHAKELHGVIAK